MRDISDIDSFPLGKENTAFAPYFSGKSWLAPLVTNKELNVPIYNVTFEPGCRNNWHKHSGGQILIAVKGVGYYQERGKTARRLAVGEVVEIPKNVEHWHGAAPNHWFSHLAVECHPQTNKNTWLEPVSDNDYQRATSEKQKDSSRKTFEVSNKVTVESVRYKNRYGITVAADLYTSKELDKTKKHTALVFGTPYGGVKEQGAGIYAMTLAQRGFVAIAFDESYNGASSGQPRHVPSPDIFVEDFSAGVDYLGTLSYVDREKIGAIGICGSGGFAVTAAQVDKRIKAVATASMYDMSRVNHYGWKDSLTKEQYNIMLNELAEQRWRDVDSGSPQYTPSFPEEEALAQPEGIDPICGEFWEYYAMKRGHHSRARGGFTTTSNMAFINFPLMNYIENISPRPILFIIGEKAHSRYFSEDAYKRASEPKELVIVPGARHIDLYDRPDCIPFDKLEDFFFTNLK